MFSDKHTKLTMLIVDLHSAASHLCAMMSGRFGSSWPPATETAISRHASVNPNRRPHTAVRQPDTPVTAAPLCRDSPTPRAIPPLGCLQQNRERNPEFHRKAGAGLWCHSRVTIISAEPVLSAWLHAWLARSLRADGLAAAAIVCGLDRR